MKENNSCILTRNFLFWSERTRFWSFGPHQRVFPWHLPDRLLTLLSWQPPHPPDHSFRCTNRKIAEIKVTVTVKVISSGSSRGGKIKRVLGGGGSHVVGSKSYGTNKICGVYCGWADGQIKLVIVLTTK